MSINRVNISGNIGREPELRRSQSGMAILCFSVAVNDRTRDKQTGEWTDYTNWVDCTVFGKRAESLGNYLSKGAKVAIEGKLRYSKWQDDNGQNRSKLEVIVDDVEFMSKGNGGNQGGGQQQQQPQQAQQQAYEPTVYDDIPF